ncbi:UPF0590 protein [Termitomyces sp. T112]|nr:hypothetical protein C0989_003653 [Termitomyces sp. Mn162]KAG5728445.1 UPF0590 protein [Termitomyces sp. T112]
MPPRLRVLAGTGTTLTPITHLVNTSNAFSLVSNRFEGEVVVCIKGLTHPEKDAYNYFECSERQGITWSIQVQGRFLEPISADDVLFGNTFDRPLGLPWGSGAALKFMSFIDPTLEHDLTSRTQPWALSPLVATMPHLIHTRIARNRHSNDYLAPSSAHSSRESTTTDTESSLPPFPPKTPISDDTSQLHLARTDVLSSSSSGSSSYGSISSLSSTQITSPAPPPSYFATATPNGSPKEYRNTISTIKKKVRGQGKGKKKEAYRLLGFADASQRRAYFSSTTHRQDIIFGPEDTLTTDFCYGFLEFTPSVMLRLPGGLSFDLMRYWDGQPVRFVCCERKSRERERGQDEGVPWGQVFWSVVIEMGDDEGSLVVS